MGAQPSGEGRGKCERTLLPSLPRAHSRKECPGSGFPPTPYPTAQPGPTLLSSPPFPKHRLNQRGRRERQKAGTGVHAPWGWEPRDAGALRPPQVRAEPSPTHPVSRQRPPPSAVPHSLHGPQWRNCCRGTERSFRWSYDRPRERPHSPHDRGPDARSMRPVGGTEEGRKERSWKNLKGLRDGGPGASEETSLTAGAAGSWAVQLGRACACVALSALLGAPRGIPASAPSAEEAAQPDLALPALPTAPRSARRTAPLGSRPAAGRPQPPPIGRELRGPHQ